MKVIMPYDTQNPESPHNIQSLLLALESEVDIYLPNGRVTTGILKEVNPLVGGRLVNMVVEIDDCYESLYWVNHQQNAIHSIVRD